MKKSVVLVLLLVFGMFFISGCESKDTKTLKGINDKLVNLDSFKELQEAGSFTSKVEDNKIIITAESEYYNGDYEYVLDGDFITTKSDSEDNLGAVLLLYISEAIAEYYDMDSLQFQSYINTVYGKDLKSDYVKYEGTEDAGTYYIYAKGKIDMSILDTINYTEEDLDFYDAFGKDSTSMYSTLANFIFYAAGDSNDSSIILGHRGELNAQVYDNILVLVKHFYPKQYDNFVKNYTEIGEKDFGKFSIKYLTDKEEINEIFEDKVDSYKFIKISYSK